MEIRPASIAQISRSRDGRMVAIEDDVQNVANSLHEIDPRLRLRYSEAGEYFVVYLKPDEWDEGDGYIVTTAQELDQRIVHRVRQVWWRTLNDPTYSYADELDKAEAKARKESDDAFSEKVGPIAEQLAFVMRRELGYNQSQIIVPRDLPDAAA